MPDTLPQGWIKTTLGEVCIPVESILPESTPDAEFSYFDIGSIDNQRNQIAVSKTVKGRTAPSRARQVLRRGDILFSTVRTYLRNIAMFEGDYPNPIGSTGFVVLRAAEGVSPHFLYYQVLSESFMRPLHALQTGSNYPAVHAHDVFAQPILLPPTREQTTIAAKLAAALAGVDRAEDAMRRARDRLQRYRAAVVHAAVTGELTRVWRERQPKPQESSETGNALLTRLLAARRAAWEEGELQRQHTANKILRDDQWKARYREPMPPRTDQLPELPEGWAWASLAQIGELDRGKSRHRPRDDARLYGGPYPFIQTGDIRRSRGTIVEHTQTYSEFGLKQSRLWPAGTLCITIAANIAETAILTYPACFPDSVVGFTQDEVLLNVRFVELCIRSEKSELERYAPATAQKNINLQTLEGLAVPLPSLAEQSEIVHEVERRLSAASRLEVTLEQQATRAHAARQSLLDEALSGRFVPQDSNDEPASLLLERIQIAKEVEARRPKGVPMAKPRSRVKTIGRRALLAVLKDSGQAMTPEELFQASGHSQESIDQFFVELRELTIDPAKISEERTATGVTLLKVVP